MITHPLRNYDHSKMIKCFSDATTEILKRIRRIIFFLISTQLAFKMFVTFYKHKFLNRLSERR